MMGEPMGTIKVKRLGLAAGVTAAIVYLGCALVMAVAGRDGVILFLNSLFHGLDVSALIRMNEATAASMSQARMNTSTAPIRVSHQETIYNLGAKKGPTHAK